MALDRHYAHCQDGSRQPALVNLVAILQDLVCGFSGDKSIIIDALDECTSRRELSKFIEQMHAWNTQIHFLATSREERDISKTFQPLATRMLCLDRGFIDADIEIHVSETLKNDNQLSLWSDKLHREIEKVLMKKADGM